MAEVVYSCPECEKCKLERDKHRQKQESERVIALKELFDKFLSKNRILYGDNVYLNVDLLELSVISYFDDIYRFKDYSGSKYADRHKQAGYTIKWLSKVKPIQILPDRKVTKPLLFVNASFALWAGFAFLDRRVSECISEKYIKHLLYTCLYRNLSGRNLASTLYVVEQFAKRETTV